MELVWIIGGLNRVQRPVQQIRFANHHGRVVSIPFTFGVLVGILTAQDFLLVLRVLKLRFREHVLKVFLADVN